MSKKKTNYNKQSVESLPDDKPVVYRIKTESGKLNYAGVAKRGRVHERLQEHIGNIPGKTVEIEQFNSIKDAKEKESRVIKRNQPKYNEQSK